MSLNEYNILNYNIQDRQDKMSNMIKEPLLNIYRQDKLEKLGYTFLRFSEGDVLYHLDDVFVQIEQGIRCLREKKCL